MRRLKKLVVIGATLIGGLVLSGCGSTYQTVKGDFAPLAGETELNIEYEYQGMTVGDFASEDEYLQDGATERDAEETGSGAAWKDEWRANRAARFQPKFEELLNSRLRGSGVRVASGLGDAKYTILVKTLHTEIGWNVAIMRRPAHINLEVKVVETANRGNELVELLGNGIPGADAWGFDYAVGDRLVQAYAKAGKELGILLADEAY